MNHSFIPRAERYNREIPWLLRRLTCWRLEPGSAEFRWGQICWKTFGFGIGYSIYHDTANFNFHFLWLQIFLKAPVLITFREGTEDWCASYGVHTFGTGIHFNWRTEGKIFHLPWAWAHVRSSVFDGNGSKRPEIAEYGDVKLYKDGRHVEKHPFIYVLRSGEIQNRIATIYGTEMEWRWHWFKWLPWPRMIQRSISISFDDEVGERTGSWKGGVMGCSFDWKNGETMKGCLQRMQHEREFR